MSLIKLHHAQKKAKGNKGGTWDLGREDEQTYVAIGCQVFHVLGKKAPFFFLAWYNRYFSVFVVLLCIVFSPSAGQQRHQRLKVTHGNSKTLEKSLIDLRFREG